MAMQAKPSAKGGKKPAAKPAAKAPPKAKPRAGGYDEQKKAQQPKPKGAGHGSQQQDEDEDVLFGGDGVKTAESVALPGKAGGANYLASGGKKRPEAKTAAGGRESGGGTIVGKESKPKELNKGTKPPGSKKKGKKG
ncbi:MAG: hypothetical protein FJ100_18700 [Deltaproteobacteria bacterium]|nr:hypothetical protein [Deltaproteobacteria bacterium]